jgi:hypothetical protein
VKKAINLVTPVVALGVWIWAASVISDPGEDNNPSQCPYGGTYGSCRVRLATYRPWLILMIGVGLLVAAGVVSNIAGQTHGKLCHANIR